MLLLLGAQTFRSDTDPRACLAVLSGLVRRTACFHLQSGDLNEACAAVDALIAGHWPKG